MTRVLLILTALTLLSGAAHAQPDCPLQSTTPFKAGLKGLDFQGVSTPGSEYTTPRATRRLLLKCGMSRSAKLHKQWMTLRIATVATAATAPLALPGVGLLVPIGTASFAAVKRTRLEREIRLELQQHAPPPPPPKDTVAARIEEDLDELWAQPPAPKSQSLAELAEEVAAVQTLTNHYAAQLPEYTATTGFSHSRMDLLVEASESCPPDLLNASSPEAGSVADQCQTAADQLREMKSKARAELDVVRTRVAALRSVQPTPARPQPTARVYAPVPKVRAQQGPLIPKESLIVVGTATSVAGVLGLMLTDHLVPRTEPGCVASPQMCGANAPYYIPAALVTGVGGAMLVTGSVAVIVDHKASPTIHLSGRF